VTESVHRRVMGGLADVISTHDWAHLGDYVHADATWEFPQSGERFRGIENIRAQFANYPAMEPGTSQLEDIIGEPKSFALTPSYTVIGVDGSGDRGTSIVRVRYPDGSLWYAINIYELRDGLIARSRSFFAPDFEAPDWRAPWREAP
jgi:ketosteroid isomerase-like protein